MNNFFNWLHGDYSVADTLEGEVSSRPCCSTSWESTSFRELGNKVSPLWLQVGGPAIADNNQPTFVNISLLLKKQKHQNHNRLVGTWRVTYLQLHKELQLSEIWRASPHSVVGGSSTDSVEIALHFIAGWSDRVRDFILAVSHDMVRHRNLYFQWTNLFSQFIGSKCRLIYWYF